MLKKIGNLSILVALKQRGNCDEFTYRGQHEKYAVATWNVETISAFV
jgi:hypothetical protein